MSDAENLKTLIDEAEATVLKLRGVLAGMTGHGWAVPTETLEAERARLVVERQRLRLIGHVETPTIDARIDAIDAILAARRRDDMPKPRPNPSPPGRRATAKVEEESHDSGELPRALGIVPPGGPKPLTFVAQEDQRIHAAEPFGKDEGIEQLPDEHGDWKKPKAPEFWPARDEAAPVIAGDGFAPVATAPDAKPVVVGQPVKRSAAEPRIRITPVVGLHAYRIERRTTGRLYDWLTLGEIADDELPDLYNAAMLALTRKNV